MKIAILSICFLAMASACTSPPARESEAGYNYKAVISNNRRPAQASNLRGLNAAGMDLGTAIDENGVLLSLERSQAVDFCASQKARLPSKEELKLLDAHGLLAQDSKYWSNSHLGPVSDDYFTSNRSDGNGGNTGIDYNSGPGLVRCIMSN